MHFIIMIKHEFGDIASLELSFGNVDQLSFGCWLGRCYFNYL